MSSDLSIFAARLRELIPIWIEECHAPAAFRDHSAAGHADAEFNGLAVLLFSLQYARNMPLRKFCEVRGITPDVISHWSQIPALPTSAFKDLELTCLPPAERTQVFHSSGTTEQRPSRHFHHAESLELYEAALWPWFAENFGLPLTDCRLLVLAPPRAQAPTSSLVHMFETVRRRMNADSSVFVGRVDASGSWLVDFASATWVMECSRRDAKPVMLLGTAFMFVHLLDALAATGMEFRLPAGSRVMETGGYKGRSRSMPKAELHALITQRLGVPASDIICEYGMSELSSQAYDSAGDEWRETSGANSPHHAPRTTHHASRVFHFPPWVRAQVISPETSREVADGETGLLRVFDLANVFSVLAIQTEDLAIRRGDGFELIGRAPLAEARGCSLMAAANP